MQDNKNKINCKHKILKERSRFFDEKNKYFIISKKDNIKKTGYFNKLFRFINREVRLNHYNEILELLFLLFLAYQQLNYNLKAYLLLYYPY